MNGYDGFGDNSGGWMTVTDSTEGAFTVQVPQGWRSQASTLRLHGELRQNVTAQSPDGNVYIFMGDPNLPTFLDPSGQMYMGFDMGFANPMRQTHPFVPADAFFRDYLARHYGQYAGFRILSINPDPEAEQRGREIFQQRGMQAHVMAVSIGFEFQDGGATVHGVILGSVTAMPGMWMPYVAGVLTTGDAARYEAVLRHMGRSFQTNAQWRQNQDNLHQQKMGMINQNHQQWMNIMQSGHQQRMDAIQQFGATNTQIWQERQAQNDISHQSYMETLRQPVPSANPTGADDTAHNRFVNYVKDEETVTDKEGQTYQVETGQDRYYINKNNNTYIGTDKTVEREDLRKRFGVNPDDYEEGRIKK